MSRNDLYSDQDVFESLAQRDWERDEHLESGDRRPPFESNDPKLWYPAASREMRMQPRGSYANGWPQGAVVHFTAGRFERGDADAKATVTYGAGENHCYFCISTTGKIYQPMPLDSWGHHCGTSTWPDLGSSLSNKLVGIEICNAGAVRRTPDGYAPWWNKPGDPRNTYLSEDQVRHVTRADNILDAGIFHRYTEAQEQALRELLLWLHRSNPEVFQIDYVLGHDEIAPRRKNDPGGSLSSTMPALRDWLRSKVVAPAIAGPVASDAPAAPPVLLASVSTAPVPPPKPAAMTAPAGLKMGPRFMELLQAYRSTPIEFGHLKDITFAQWAHETGYGTSELAVRFNNYAGMKWRPDMKVFATQAYYKPAHDPMDTAYCSFSSLGDFIKGYWHRLDIRSLPYASKAGGWRSHAGAPSEFIDFIGPIWAPEGGDNSPLNNGYVRKVKSVHARLTELGLLPSMIPAADQPRESLRSAENRNAGSVATYLEAVASHDRAEMVRGLESLRQSLSSDGLAPHEIRELLEKLLANPALTRGGNDSDPFDHLIEAIKVASAPVPPRTLDLNHAAAKVLDLLTAGTRPIRPSRVEDLLKALRAARAFDWLAQISDRLILTGQASTLVQRYHAQALVDSGHVRAAMYVLEDLKRQPLAKTELDEVMGQLGRANKQIYVDHVPIGTVDPGLTQRFATYLREAVRHYEYGYDDERAGETSWHGINVVALARRAAADGVRLEPAVDWSAIARRIAAELDAKKTAGKATDWDIAVLGEAYLALGEFEKAKACYLAYASHPDRTYFKLAGSIRQLEQVWRADRVGEPLRDCLLMLKAAAAEEPVAGIRLTAAERRIIRSDRFETAYPDSEFVKHSRLRQIVRAGECIAWIKNSPFADQGVGTGFLIVGSTLAPALGDDLYLLTNTHVICDGRIDDRWRDPGSLLPEQAYVQFEASDEGTDTQAPQTYRLEREAVWLSPSSEYDACLLRFVERPPQRVSPARIAPATDWVTAGNDDDDRDGTPVAVLGHAGGGELQIGLRGSILNHQGNILDRGPRLRDTEAPIYLHYDTPTLGGNSGSPVYDARTWTVIGLHHAGYDERQGRPRLRGRGGHHFANEGIDIRSLAEAIQRDLSRGRTSFLSRLVGRRNVG